ncbi:poly(A)-specific ribonuclease [Nowakowskiella sp. JEL0078]|nr:poly(A)-specific ribonuclease [Nowakowskiella sp. JEL0078]
MVLSEKHVIIKSSKNLNNTKKKESVSSVLFDVYEELVCVGKSNALVQTFTLQHGGFSLYSSRKQQVIPASNSIPTNNKIPDSNFYVRNILSLSPSLLVSLSAKRLELSKRQGISVSSFSPDTNFDLTACALSNSSDIWLALKNGLDLSAELATVNFLEGRFVNKFKVEAPIIKMVRSRFLCSGNVLGKIELRDHRNGRREHLIDAHTGTLNDFDVEGNTLITCGYGLRSGQMLVEPLVKVFDLRTMKTLPPISFSTVPQFLKFHPKLTSTIYISSQTGQFQSCDLTNPNHNVEFYQIKSNALITCFDASSSGEMVAFGSEDGSVHIWTEKPSDYVINSYSRTSVLPDHGPGKPITNITIGDDDPLSLVGMPYYDAPLLSATWPINLTFDVGKTTPKIPKEVLINLKINKEVVYAPNPGGLKRNTQLAGLVKIEAGKDVPRFRSEKERAKYSKSKEDKNIGEAEVDDPPKDDATITSTSDFMIPKRYRKVEILYSKFGIEDFDFGFYNQTSYGGLETHISNSYCNSILQVLFFTGGDVLRRGVLSHARVEKNGWRCTKEKCLACELAWLFKMMRNAPGLNCHAGNFLRVFGMIPQANALGLFEPEDQNITQVSFSLLIQNFTRFIMEQLHQELHNNTMPNDSGESWVQQVAGVLTDSSTNCCICGNKVVRVTCPCKNYVCGHRETVDEEGINNKSLVCKLQQVSAYKSSENDINGKSWLSLSFELAISDNELFVSETIEGLETEIEGKPVEKASYELTAVVMEVDEGLEASHLVAQIKVKQPDGSDKWFLFNDFLVQEITSTEVVQFRKWKLPAVVQFTRKDLNIISKEFNLNTDVDCEILIGDEFLNKDIDLKIMYKPLAISEIENLQGSLCAIDSEFVLLSKVILLIEFQNF